MPQPVAVIMLAKPSAGKGTNIAVVREILGDNTEIISTSQIFSTLKDTHPDDHRKVEAIKASGHLVPDELTNRLVDEYLDTINRDWHLIFDGFPRSGKQERALWPMLKKRGIHPGRVVIVELVVSDKICAERAAGRVKEALAQDRKPRADDDPKVVKKRLGLYRKSYQEIMGPLVVSGAQCLRINATGTKSEVAEAIREAWPFREAMVV